MRCSESGETTSQNTNDFCIEEQLEDSYGSSVNEDDIYIRKKFCSEEGQALHLNNQDMSTSAEDPTL